MRNTEVKFLRPIQIEKLPETGFLRLPQIIGNKKQGIPPIIPIGRSTWWHGVKTGRFPKPIKISAGITVWRVEDIRKLIESDGNDGKDAPKVPEIPGNSS